MYLLGHQETDSHIPPPGKSGPLIEEAWEHSSSQDLSSVLLGEEGLTSGFQISTRAGATPLHHRDGPRWCVVSKQAPWAAGESTEGAQHPAVPLGMGAVTQISGCLEN